MIREDTAALKFVLTNIGFHLYSLARRQLGAFGVAVIF